MFLLTARTEEALGRNDAGQCGSKLHPGGVGFAESFLKNLYRDVMLETFENLTSVEIKWKDQNITDGHRNLQKTLRNQVMERFCEHKEHSQ